MSHELRWTSLMLCAAVTLHAAVTRAEEPAPAQEKARSEREACLSAHRAAQRARRSNQLLEARSEMETCSRQECPGAVVTDCAAWLAEITPAIPSLIFDVNLDGQSAPLARVFVNDEPFDGWAQGSALEVNPGQHTLRVELDGYEPIRDSVVVSEGMKFRVVTAHFRDNAPSLSRVGASDERLVSLPGSEPSRSQSEGAGQSGRPVPPLAYVLSGVGFVGVAGFVALGAWGKAEQNRLDRECVPRCEERQLDAMLVRYTLADVSLTVGLGSFLGAGVVYGTRPRRPPRVAVGWSPAPAGAGVSVSVTGF
jgi:hypothetical protein